MGTKGAKGIIGLFGFLLALAGVFGWLTAIVQLMMADGPAYYIWPFGFSYGEHFGWGFACIGLGATLVQAFDD